MNTHGVGNNPGCKFLTLLSIITPFDAFEISFIIYKVMKYQKILIRYNAYFKKAVFHSRENIKVVFHSRENI